MNQILITGEERGKRENKTKTALDIKTIISFYAISIILLGIFFIGGSVYAMGKIDEQVKLNTKPTVETARIDEDNTIEIFVKHIRGIKTIEYKWNDEESQTIDGKNQKEVREKIKLVGGINKLTVTVTEENGQIVKYEKTYNAGDIPKIELQAVSNGVKIITSSENKINYITYSWDNEEPKTIQVGKKEYEGTIDVPEGQHTLNIEVVDVNKNIATKTQVIVGDAAPTLSVKGKKVDGAIGFFIEAEDDQKITKVEITFNGGQKEIIEVNETTFSRYIPVTKLGDNTIIVTVYNNNGLSTTERKLLKKK